jgi:hypothetical protein
MTAITLEVSLAATASAQSQIQTPRESSQSAAHPDPGRLLGTWQVQITLLNCVTQVPLAPPFASMLAFEGAGTLTGTTANPAFAPGQRSSDYGTWNYKGHGTYVAASDAYILFPAGPFVRGTQRIVQAISVSGDTFTSAATVTFYDVNGNNVLGACAVAQAHRFQ